MFGEEPLRKALASASGMELYRGDETISDSLWGDISPEFSPDGQWLVLRGSKKSQWINVNNHSLVKERGASDISVDGGHATLQDIPEDLEKSIIASSSDGRRIVLSEPDGTLRVSMGPEWSPRVIGALNEGVMESAVSSDGRMFAVSDYSGALQVFDLDAVELGRSGVIHIRENYPGGWVEWLSFGSGSRLLAAHCSRGILIWNLTKPGAKPLLLKDSKGGYDAISLSQNGKFFARSYGNGNIQLWTIGSLEAAHLRSSLDKIVLLQFSADGRWLAGISQGTSVQILDLNNIEAEPRVLRAHDEIIAQLDFSPRSDRLLTQAAGRVVLWDLLGRFSEPKILHVGEYGACAIYFSDNAHLVAAGNRKSFIFELGPRESKSVEALEPAWRAVTQDGRWVGGISEGALHLWDLRSPRSAPQVIKAETPISWLALSSDGKEIAAIQHWETIDLWRQGGAKPFRRLTAGGEDFQALALSSNGDFLGTAGTTGVVRLWNLTKKKPEGRLLGKLVVLEGHLAMQDNHEGAEAYIRVLIPERILAFSPQGTYFAARSDHEMQLWYLHDLNARPLGLAGLGEEIRTFTFSGDEKHIAVGGRHGSVYLWNLEDVHGTPTRLSGDKSRVLSIAFSPDGHWLAALDAGGSIRIWSMRIDDLIARGCQLGGRNLTHAEWRQYMTEKVPYHRTCSEFPALR